MTEFTGSVSTIVLTMSMQKSPYTLFTDVGPESALAINNNSNKDNDNNNCDYTATITTAMSVKLQFWKNKQ